MTTSQTPVPRGHCPDAPRSHCPGCGDTPESVAARQRIESWKRSLSEPETDVRALLSEAKAALEACAGAYGMPIGEAARARAVAEAIDKALSSIK